LQGLPHQLQEGLGLLGRDKVLPVDLPALLQVIGVVRQACTAPQKGSRSTEGEDGTSAAAGVSLEDLWPEPASSSRLYAWRSLVP
jgi:hypothetical protein